MSHEQHDEDSDSSRFPFKPSRAPVTGNGYSGLRAPAFDGSAYILILLVVLIPIIFTLILCLVTYCIYRYNKSRSHGTPTTSPTDQSVPTVIYNTQHSPFFFEESPPSYDSLAKIKKDPHDTITSNEQIQLTVLPNATITNTDEVTSAAALVLPSAPIPPPPPYTNLDGSNK